MTYADFQTGDNVVPITAGGGSGVGRMQKAVASYAQDVSEHLTEEQLAEIGAKVVQEWQADREANKDWRDKAEQSLDSAAQEPPEAKTYPWDGAANVRYPLLTISALAFQSRAYPAIVKGDEAIKIKTFGKDPSGKKAARATRLAEYLNWKLFYGVEGWEDDTDAMLLRLPIIGQHYRKVWWDPIKKQPCIESVSALRLTVPPDARTLETSPRITHDFDRYPYEIAGMVRAGHWRKVVLPQAAEDDQASRLILEQHRMMDLDKDGLEEPYVVTVDHATEQVLRIEEAFGDEDIHVSDAPDYDEETGQATDKVERIDRWCPFVGYGFIPDPKGRAYSIGFGYLLSEIMEVIDTNINLMLDAGHAQVAGGGFIASELRLQNAGQNSTIYFEPGEYKTVQATGQDIRQAIYERTFPAPSPVLFQLLGLLMEAAKDIASVNEAITGDAARTAPVGTTLALIEQGQQVFNAIYKRVYRSLRREYKLFLDCLAKYADPAEYARFCDVDATSMMGHNGGPAMDGLQQPQQAPQGLMAGGPALGGQQPQGMVQQAPQAAPPPQPVDPEALFRADFNADDLDVRPVSDPSAVTKAQVLAKDQFALAFVGKGIYADDRAVIRQALLDAGIEQAEEWIPEKPPGPDPVQLQLAALKAQIDDSKAKQLQSSAVLNTAKAAQIAHESTGPQADAKVAEQVASAHEKLVNAAATAEGLLANLSQPDAHPAPVLAPPAPEYP